MKYTPLYSRHCALGAKMTSFSGWQMPVAYRGTLHEHQVVRERVGLFDLSHMGRIALEGPDCLSLLEYLSTNRIAGKSCSATYTVWCKEDGSSVDDVIIYIRDSESAFIIANAANREKDLAHIRRCSIGYDIEIIPCWDEEGILALQGPQALKTAALLFPEAERLVPMHFLETTFEEKALIISKTGYTGAGGVEFFGESAAIVALWDRLLLLGGPYGIEPIGLGARDTLRLEAGFALYGHELSEGIAATESVAAWTVKWDKEFLGKAALLELENDPFKRHAAAFVIEGKAIARDGSKLLCGNKVCGTITSGGFSPTLQKPIALALVVNDFDPKQLIEVEVRGVRSRALPVELPFLPKIPSGQNPAIPADI